MSDNTILNTVNGVTASTSTTTTSSTSTTAGGALDKDAFLQLLVTQMQYQDPLDPQDNSEYVSQLAQFSALEQMTTVADAATTIDSTTSSQLIAQLSSMIGQTIEWTDSDSDTTYSGTALGVSITDGTPTVLAQASGSSTTTSVPVSEITLVGSDTTSS